MKVDLIYVITGVNLFEKVLYKNVDAVISRAFAAGVSQSLLISIDAQTSATSVEICKKHLQSLYATAGVHPLYIGNAPVSRGDADEKKLIVEDEKSLQPAQPEGAEAPLKSEDSSNNNEKPKEKDLKTELNAVISLVKHNPEYIAAIGEIGLDFKDNLAPGKLRYLNNIILDIRNIKYCDSRIWEKETFIWF